MVSMLELPILGVVVASESGGISDMKAPSKHGDSIVLIVEDDAQVRKYLEALLKSVGLHAKSFAGPIEFLRYEVPETPCCVVLDVRLPGLSGLEVQRELAARKRPIPIIFITGYGDIPMSVSAMKGGAVEFLTKPFREQDMLDAIHNALDRDSADAKSRLELNDLHVRAERLTPREREVVAYVVQGMLNKQIAARLGTSEITVKIQRGSAMKKLKAGSVPDLVRIADRLGLGKGGGVNYHR